MSDDVPAGEPDDPRLDPLPRPTCRGTVKRTGRPCRNKAAAGSAYCGAHGGGERKPGAPVKLTPDVRDKITDAVESGATYEVAAATAGVHRETLRVWRERGAADVDAGRPTEFADLYGALTRAQADGEAELVRRIRAHGKDDWRPLAWILERRHPERWARRQHVDLTATEQSVPRTVDPATPGQAEQIRAILGRALEPPPST